jgi:tyrosyl-tRNA synthetase
MKTWEKQASKVLDFSKVKIRFNGDWLTKLTLPELIRIASNISAAQLFQRDMFQARLKRGDTVWTHELLYPLLQGYDSVALQVDLEIGGSDQLFNMLVGRELQKKMRDKEKYVLCTPMLLGLDGKPMSKTSGNTVNLSDSAQDMYGKLMSMKDELISHYFELCTQISRSEVANLNPRDAKAKLAREIVSLYHGKTQAQRAEQEFVRVFKKGKSPAKIPLWKPSRQSLALRDLVVEIGFAKSKSEARRLIEQGGVKIDQKTERDPTMVVRFRKDMVIQGGKRKFVKVAV